MVHEALNNLALGILADTDIRGSPYLGLVAESARPALAMVMSPHHPVVVGGSPGRAALDLAAGSLRDEGLTVPGVIGPRDLATGFGEAWTRSTGARARLHMEQRIYRLDAVRALPPAPGRFAPATPDHETLACEWTVAFSIEAATRQSVEETRPRVRELIEATHLYLWLDPDPVSMAAASRMTPNGASVSGVYTPPDKRGRGYATACVTALSRHLLAQGRRFCTLYTDLANATSNRIYQRIGYVAVGDSRVYHFSP
jgi:hypothetical protein